MKHLFYTIAAAAFLGCATTVSAADFPEKPVVHTIEFENGGTVYAMSDNGKWVVGDAVAANDASHNGYATLVNAETGEVIKLYPESNPTIECTARDVTDDGDVAGSYNNRPAIYRRAEKRWQILPLEGDWDWISLTSITPDGRYAVSRVVNSDWTQAGYAWKIDGDKAELIEFKGLGKVSRLEKITPDGKIYGRAGMTIEGGGMSFLYDVHTDTYQTFGSGNNSIHGVNPMSLSPNGRYMASIGGGRVTIYDLQTGEYTTREDKTGSELDVIFVGVGDDGALYGYTQHDLMFRNWYVHVGNYWYDFREIMRQIYGIDWYSEYAKDYYNHSGTFWAVDNTGSVVAATDYVKSPTTSYIVRMPKPFVELCPEVDLLSTYMANPPSGASFSKMQSISVNFQRQIDVIGNDNVARLEDADGNLVANSVSFRLLTGDDRTLSIVFRNRTLEEGKEYHVVIPAGAFCLKGDAENLNREMRFSYTGRPNRPVSAVKIFPEDGNEVPRINLSSNPVQLTFDTDLSVCENPQNEPRINIYIEREDGEDELVRVLNADVNGRNVSIYPVNELQLAQGTDYKLVVSAGTFADLSGSCPNEEIVVRYKGSYTPDLPTNDKVIFSDDFANGLSSLKWMFYEGDGNTPSAEMLGWDFTADTTPWWFVRDNVNSTDWAACSHSSYSPAGQSDDWMVTTGLYIADDSYTLSFDSQSYRNAAQDRLKVYVWPTEDVITALTPSIINRMRYESKVVYNEIQSPGKREDTMAGDWRANEVSLAEFAGKRVYIAFVNENFDQSAIFLDNIEVSRDLKVALEVFSPEYVKDMTEIEINGRFTVMTDSETYSDIALSLYNADGEKVDALTINDKEYKAGDSYNFAFPVKLPLEKGKQAPYRVEFTSGTLTMSASGRVKNMIFEPVRRVVLEEYTGTTCQFCPQGLAVIDILDKQYGDLFIPIAIHGYPGSQFANSITDDYSQFLGMNSAPSATINRKWLAAPMDDGYVYLSPKSRLWYDIVTEELGLPADAEVNVDSFVVDEDARTASVAASVRYAFDADNLNLGILTVVLEDGLLGLQTNGIYNSTSPHLGEWANGGKYASQSPLYEFNDIMRGINGTTLNGTGGHIPASVEAGKEYKADINFDLPQSVYAAKNTKAVVMLIDGNTGRVINAARSKAVTSGVETIASQSQAKVTVVNGAINVDCPGLFTAMAYAADGRMLASLTASESAVLDIAGYKGIVLVKVVNGSQSSIAKLMVR